MTNDRFTSWTKPQLIAFARERGVPYPASATRDQLAHRCRVHILDTPLTQSEDSIRRAIDTLRGIAQYYTISEAVAILATEAYTAARMAEALSLARYYLPDHLQRA